MAITDYSDPSNLIRIDELIPDPNDRQVITRAERIKWHDTGTLQQVSPTAEDPYSIFLSNRIAVDALNFASQEPILAQFVAQTDEAAALLPELASATSTADVSAQLLEHLYEDHEARSEHYAGLDLSEEESRMFEEISKLGNRDLILTIESGMVGLTPEGRKYMAAKTMEWLSTHDMTAPTAIVEAQAALWQEAAARQQFELSETGVVGSLGKVISQPLRFTQSVTRSAWANAASPQDAWWRDDLTLFQNVALSTGAIPGTTRYQMTSGIGDGVFNVIGDPVAWVANVAAGVKIAKTLPLVASAAKGGRATLALKSLLPIKGARSLGLPMFTRTPTARMGYLFAAKNLDDFVETPKFVKMSEALAGVSNPLMIGERIPEFRHAVGLNAAIARETNPEAIRHLIKQAYRGGFDSQSDLALQLRQRAEAAQHKLDDRIKFEVERNHVRPESILIDGSPVERIGMKADDEMFDPEFTASLNDKDSIRRVLDYDEDTLRERLANDLPFLQDAQRISAKIAEELGVPDQIVVYRFGELDARRGTTIGGLDSYTTDFDYDWTEWLAGMRKRDAQHRAYLVDRNKIIFADAGTSKHGTHYTENEILIRPEDAQEIPGFVPPTRPNIARGQDIAEVEAAFATVRPLDETKGSLGHHGQTYSFGTYDDGTGQLAMILKDDAGETVAALRRNRRSLDRGGDLGVDAPEPSREAWDLLISPEHTTNGAITAWLEEMDPTTMQEILLSVNISPEAARAINAMPRFASSTREATGLAEALHFGKWDDSQGVWTYGIRQEPFDEGALAREMEQYFGEAGELSRYRGLLNSFDEYRDFVLDEIEEFEAAFRKWEGGDAADMKRHLTDSVWERIERSVGRQAGDTYQATWQALMEEHPIRNAMTRHHVPFDRQPRMGSLDRAGYQEFLDRELRAGVQTWVTSKIENQRRFSAVPQLTQLDGSGAEKFVFEKGAKILYDGTTEAENVTTAAMATGRTIQEQAQEMGYAGYRWQDTMEVLDDRKILIGVDNADLKRSETMESMISEMVDSTSEWKSFDRAGTTHAYVIKDMPRGKYPVDIDDFSTKRVTPRQGGSNASSWWQRSLKSRFWGKYPPAEINIASAYEGGKQLKIFLRYIGVPEEDVFKFAGRFMDADFTNRYKVVRDIIEEAAEVIDHPLIKHNLIEYVNRQGVRSFGVAEDGTEILKTASRSNPAGESARPIVPSHLTTTVHLPDPVGVAKSLARYKWSKNRYGPSFTKGILSGTQRKRQSIKRVIESRLRAQYGDDFLKGISQEELFHMAYASVGPHSAGDNAQGAVAHMANTVHRAWRWATSAFSIAQLAFRPFAWSGRVLLDENARGAFAGLPSIMRNPVRYLSSTMDAHYLGKAEELRRINLQWAQDTMNTIKANPGRLEEFIPNIRQVLSKEVLEGNERTLMREVGRLLNRYALENDFGEVTRGVPLRQQRRYQRAINIAEELGIDLRREAAGFSWDEDVSEIINKGWSQLYSLEFKVQPVQHVVGQMTEATKAQYARVYQRNLELLANDPMARVAMKVWAKRLTGEPLLSTDYDMLVHSNGWIRLQEEARNWATATYGSTPSKSIDQMTQYIDGPVLDYVKTLYEPLLDADPFKAAGQLDEIANTRTLTVNGTELDLRRNNNGLREIGEIVDRLDGEKVQLPPQSGFIAPYGLMDEPADNWWPRFRNAPSKIIEVFGDSASQHLQRRGAWLETFRHEKEVRMAFGASEAAAIRMAQDRASETVNNVYYNLQSVTPFLKSMNQVVPFFTAAWEIAQTWAWKVPMMQGGVGVGHAQMLRKIDRVFDALRELGLVRYDEEGRPALYLDRNADTGNFAGDALSKNAALLLQQPLKIAEHLANLGHAITGTNPDEFEEDGIVPDRFTFAVSSPVDIDNYGIGSALDIALAPQPIAHWALTNLREQIPAVAQHKNVPVSGTLQEIALEHDVDPMRIIGYNVDTIIDEYGPEHFQLITTGAIPASMVEFDDIELRMPNTSLWSRMVDDAFFPFGDTNDAAEVVKQFHPAWISYVFRGLGLWDKADDEDGFLAANLGQFTDGAVAGSVVSAVRHLSATEGVFSRMKEYRDEFYALATPYLENESAYIDGNGNFRFRGALPADAEEVNAAWFKLKSYSDNVMLRSIENAASSNMMRGMLAFVLPGTPRMFYEEERAVDGYYQAMNAERALTEGGSLYLDNVEIDETIGYLWDWLEDPTGGSAMRSFVDTHPQLQPYLQGKSYWTPGGQPPLERELELYFSDIEEGLRAPIPPDVFLHRMAIAQNETERQVAFIEKYGQNPHEAAAASLRDPQGYKDLMEEYNTHRERLAWEDELNGSPYASFKDKNRGDRFSIIAEAQREYAAYEGAFSEMIDMVEASPQLTIAEVDELSGQLKGLRAGVRELRESFEQVDSDYSWMHPHQKYRMQYFDEVYGPYMDALGEQYDLLDESKSSEENDQIWARIASIKDMLNNTDVIIGGTVYPTPLQFQTENKHPALRERRVMESITWPGFFLDEHTVSELLKDHPQLDEYVPSTPMQRNLYNEYTGWRDKIDAQYANGTGEMTYKERNAAMENLDTQFRDLLIQNGWQAHVEWSDMWDVQRLSIAGELPPSFTQYQLVEQATAIQRARLAKGYKSVGEDDPGRRALTATIWRYAESDPVFMEELQELGITLYGEGLLDTIIPKLFFNDNY